MLPAPRPVPFLRVGCPMWAHPPWRGRLLPDDGGRGDQLAAYATWCNAVEGNTTYYGVPSATTVRSWADQAPEHFRFLFKLPRTITHERRLRDADDDVRAFLAAIEPLGDRAETVSIQLPASFGPAGLGVLAEFLVRLPSEHRFAVEVRHPSFFDGSAASRTLRRLLRDRDVELIAFDTATLFASPPTSDAERDAWANKPRLPVRPTAVTDEPIVRFLGRDDVDATVAGWQRWVPVVARWLVEGRRPTVFVHTPDNGEGPALARRFHDDVRAVVADLDPLPTPRRPERTTLF